MLDVVEIVDFDYHPPAEYSEVTLKGPEAREVDEDDEATPTTQDPLLLPMGEFR